MHLLQEKLASAPPVPTISQPAASGRAAQPSQLRPRVPAQPRPGQRAELLATLRAKAMAGAPAPSAGRLAIVEELKTKYWQALAQGALPPPSTAGGAPSHPAPEEGTVWSPLQEASSDKVGS